MWNRNEIYAKSTAESDLHIDISTIGIRPTTDLQPSKIYNWSGARNCALASGENIAIVALG